MHSNIRKKLKKIKLVLTDVDGVLTDGGMYYTKDGEFMKKFNTKDSMSMELLLTYKIKTAMITRENSKVVKKRAKKIKVTELYSGILNKKMLLPKILKKYNVKRDQVAYIGDDINDLSLINIVGFSICPNDAVKQVKDKASMILNSNGGYGCVREFSDIYLSQIS